MTTLTRSAVVAGLFAYGVLLLGCGGGGGGAVVPAAPTGANSPATTATSVTIAWTDNSNNETGFEIQRAEAGPFATIANVAADATTYTDPGLAEGTQYTYRVRAVTAAASSDWSNVVVATTGTSTGTVSGRVVNLETAAPIAGAAVSVDGLGGATAAAGTFSIPDIAPGLHTLTVVAAGYVMPGGPVGIDVAVGANDIGDVAMQPDSGGPPPPPPL